MGLLGTLIVNGKKSGSPGNVPVLAILTPQGAAAEKDGAAATAACQRRLFPFMDHGFCHPGLPRTAAIAGFSRCAVNITFSWAQFTVRIIHCSIPPLGLS